ncbi:MAG: SDR family NAD(P)-dependent oxidoreductase [Oscillospiraceae bacterium]|nr:SDR family NAD(P)-dependent oxidoreductase [Oscillospiraceae bacterium]
MKYALFTGASGGLGGAGAKALASAGWTVFAADINEATLEEIGTTPRIIPLLLDVTSQKSIDIAVETVKRTIDKLDAVINFAGIHTMGSMVEGDIAATMAKMLDINVMGMIRVNRAFFEMVKAGGGRIINCSSECGYMKAQPFNGPYTVTKYAVEVYNDSLRRELLCQGIKVIKIQPGSFKTNLHNAAQAGFDKLYDSTRYYKNALKKMQPLMTRELKKANDPVHLVRVLLKAAERKNPKINYRVKNSRLMGMIEFIPDILLDSIYKVLLRNIII